MTELSDTSLKACYFKCFGESPEGFNTFTEFNILIGRNNSGKSALIDLLKVAANKSKSYLPQFERTDGEFAFEFGFPLTEEHIKIVFPPGADSTERPEGTSSDYSFGSQFTGHLLPMRIDKSWKLDGARFPTEWDWVEESRKDLLLGELTAQNVRSKFDGFQIREVAAERDIYLEPKKDLRPEPEGINMQPDGRGATNFVRAFVTEAARNPEHVEVGLLRSLNKIYQSDNEFSSIRCRDEGGNWEIYLREEEKGLIRLSESGSGLKTIILILIQLHLIPLLNKHPLERCIFALEEIENNLHPALLRRLLNFLWKWQEEHGSTFVISTHSNVLIDWFSKKENAQIIHVTHNGTDATCTPATGYMDNREILDDLDFRASDILQANGIIWVEGPSDRIYLKRWIEIWSNGEFQEGTHYQILIYGGLLLNHFEALAPDNSGGRMSLLSANRHCAVLMDSDRKKKIGAKAAPRANLSATKRRIRDEVIGTGGFAWVTAGRMIENYVPIRIWREFLDAPKFKDVGPYGNVFDRTALKKYSKPKQILAHELTPLFERSDLETWMDLGNQLETLCSAIRAWNKIEE